MRSRTKVVGGACAALLAVTAVAVAVSGGDPRQPTRSSSPLVSIGQPITPYRAGEPARGWIELRVSDPDRRGALALLHHEFVKVRRGRPLRHVCAEVGLERSLRHLRIGRGGNCLFIDPRYPSDPLSLSWSSGFKGSRAVRIQGLASAEVKRIVVEGPGGTYEVPLARHRAFMLVYSAKATGSVTFTAHLRDGGTRYSRVDLRPAFPPGRGSVAAPDPAGLEPWRVSAEIRSAGARKGQTCAQFAGARREFGAPMCGDLSANALFADATRYGPRPTRGAFGPGPKSPERLIVWGAVSPSVRGVRIADPARGTRRLALSAVGRAFIAVYPASTDPRSIALEVALADGTVQRHVAPHRLNVVASAG